MVSTSVVDKERANLISLLGLTDQSASNLSLVDLYKLALDSHLVYETQGAAGTQLQAYLKLLHTAYRPKLASWYNALAQYQTRRANIVLQGASITEGYGASSYDKTPAQVLAKQLRTLLGISGGGRGYMGAPAANLVGTAATPFTFTGGTHDALTFNYGAKHQVWYGNAAGQKFVWTTPPEGITSFIIQVFAGNTGGATAGYYKIGAAAAVNFSTLNGAVIVRRISVAGPIAGNTVIEIGCNGGGFVVFDGVQEFNGDENSGVQVHNCGHYGFTAAQWNNVAAVDWSDSIAALSPDVICMMDFMVNDGWTLQGNKLAAAAKTDLLAVIARLRAHGATCPILLCGEYDVTPAITFLEPWSKYLDALYQIADADPTVGFVDFAQFMPLTSVSTAMYAADHVHGNPNGITALALSQVLISQLVGGQV